MGGVLGICSIASWIPCLCSSATCILCRCCPSSGNSTVTRLIYAFLMFLGTLLSIVMLTPGISEQLKKVPGFCEGGFGTELPHVNGYVNCNVLVGYKAVYRVSFAMSMFFLVFSLLMIGVKTSKDPRAAVHNGFWFFKILAIVGIMVGAFYIPEGPFTRTWFWIGVVGAGCFIVIQLVLLVDFAHSVNESWVERMDEGNSKCWYAVLLTVTSLLYILSLIGIILFYVFYTIPGGCVENKFFISFNMILCIIVSIISILPKVQVQARWCSPDHDRTCNPSLISILNKIAAPTINPLNVSAMPDLPTPEPPKSLQWWDTQSIIGLIMFVLCLLYSSPDADLNTITSKWPAVWVKMGSSWFCLLLYTWTLIGPCILPNRDFT
ncbi:hypothetical protein GDO78_004660 [Eleutherodactylus coqui]|uniref:Serine incorporator 3 n=1 Tax=Eleutherodactylus coqui TaxID=57060 RepID=A0A8J6ERH1_ELECQ|nr:hypothetical protein GDO78_004660 [Eleutherodactylus coqui]